MTDLHCLFRHPTAFALHFPLHPGSWEKFITARSAHQPRSKLVPPLPTRILLRPHRRQRSRPRLPFPAAPGYIIIAPRLARLRRHRLQLQLLLLHRGLPRRRDQTLHRPSQLSRPRCPKEAWLATPRSYRALCRASLPPIQAK